ncbi:hypothetical protein [Amycolatopsis anabasis]|uniref:hypothetical protein n=1 Tax=Amycolatopsis anabasis TaxID=1840409 RepID=UPI00131A98D7|nr:hypothetical protein [Amycolatopsis anabasis]
MTDHADEAAPPTTRENLRRAKSFSPFGLLVTVAGSILGTVIPTAFGEGPVPTLLGAASLAVLTAAGLTGADGTARGVRAIAAVLLAIGAVALTVSGVTLTDLIRGKSLNGEHQNTFPVAPAAAEPPTRAPSSPKTVKPGISLPATLDCGRGAPRTAHTCPAIEVRSTGGAPLKITKLEFDGPHRAEFAVDRTGTDCGAANLDPGDECAITLRFTPAAPGNRTARLVVHQNLPGPASFVKLTGTGSGRPPTATPSTLPPSG